VTAAPTVRIDPLIAEARRRARRRRLTLVAVAPAAGGTVLGARLSGSSGADPAATLRRIEAVARAAPVAEAGSSAGVGWATSGCRLWVTADGGRTWTPLEPPERVPKPAVARQKPPCGLECAPR
jgi:hypothetical protein